MKFQLRMTTFALALALVSTQASAALLFEEYFDYGTSDLQSSYGAWTDGTSRVLYDADTNLVYSGSGYSAPANATTGSLQATSSNGDQRAAQISYGSGQTGTFFVSALMRLDSSLDSPDGVFIGLNGGRGYSNTDIRGDAFGIGAIDASNVTVAFFDDSATATSLGTGSFSASETMLMIAEVTVNSGGQGVSDDALRIWAFDGSSPVPSTVVGLGTALFSTNAAEFDAGLSDLLAGRFDQVAGYIDAIRVSDQSGDAGLLDVTGRTSDPIPAVPEPASALLIVLGAAGLFRRRSHA